jgi:hypothetical protein
MRIHAVLLCLILCSISLVRAGELQTALFVQTPPPGAQSLWQPRSVLVDPFSKQPIVTILDSGLREVVTFTAGEEEVPAHVTRRALSDFDLPYEQALPADPLLPIPLLAASATDTFLVLLDRATRTLTITSLHDDAAARTVILPDHATNGAVMLDDAGRVVVVALRASAAGVELLLSREENTGFVTLDTLKDPCEGQAKNLALTGFAIGADGRLAIGLAQTGAATYSFIRSWLVQGALTDGKLTRALQTTHRFVLLDSRGKPTDRFRAAVDLAGRLGYPAKPCVPLFTTLILGPNGAIISGGHTLDPFLRVFDRAGHLQASFPRQAAGGQHVAAFLAGETPHLYVTDAANSRVDIRTLDGRMVGSVGTPLPYDLATVLALAADSGSVYAVTRGAGGLRLLRFTTSGGLAWSQPLTPPRGLEKAQPHLAALGNERVFLGWRQPDADGVGMVEVVLEDGTRGVSLWADPWPGTSNSVAALTPTPLVAGRNGRLYVQRTMKDGTRVQAFSPAGGLMLTFPPTVGGVSAVLADSTLAWAHPGENGLVMTLFSAQGVQTGWKRIRQEPGDLIMAQTSVPWGWQGTTGTLLRMDDTLTIVEELSVFAPNRERLATAVALAGDRETRLYFALPDRILVGAYEP